MINEGFHLDKPLRWGMVGGGQGSQIGYIHRNSAARDRLFQLVAAALDINPERGLAFGLDLGLDPTRCYPDYQTLFQAEAGRADGIEVVSIATPNATHFEICKAALEHGLHVICEKPLCFTTEQAEVLAALAIEKNRVVGVTYGYSGFQMIHQAREMVAKGDLGEVRIIVMQFAHGFHSAAVEAQDAGTKWRVTPAQAGPSYVLGDVGTHVLFLAKTIVPQLKLDAILCSRQSFIKSREPLEDNAFVMLQYEGGAVGTLWASAVNAGSMHQQKIRVVGSKASVEWWDEHPNQLRYEVQGRPAQVLERGMDYLYPELSATVSDRIGGGHAEGLFEAWSNLYRQMGRAMDLVNQGQSVETVWQQIWYPTIRDGLEGVQFVNACVRSADLGGIWVDFSSSH
ncbi:MAG: Gfo/Idh/MocA family oxidoreductase [Eubacteriales bacterium]|nr:Gfo/Idh/MocA family oxidoreductase [Eubacteriales bacterium]